MTYKSCRKGIQNQFGLINNIFDCHQWGEDVKFCRSRTKFIPSPMRKMVFIIVWVPSLSQNKGGTNLSFKPGLSWRSCSHVWGNKPLVISHLFLFFDKFVLIFIHIWVSWYYNFQSQVIFIYSIGLILFGSIISCFTGWNFIFFQWFI